MPFRELSGWAIALALLVYPFVLLTSLVVWVDGHAPAVSFFGTLLIGFAWPGAYLAARRLREPDERDVAEADGRAPVLILHAFERSRGAWWQRMLAPPRMVRDFADARLERALHKSLTAAGPILTLARPVPPPTSGPVALTEEDGTWEPALEARLVGARLVAIVLDGTPENRREIDIVASHVDPRRIVLIAPPNIDAGFLTRWAAIRVELPGLPEIDHRIAAVRFDANRLPTPVTATYSSYGARLAALSEPSLMLRGSEIQPRPDPPSVSWVLSALPIGVALFGSIATPLLLDAVGNGVNSGETATFTAGSLGCAVALAIMSRRAMRLVPGNELPMVLVAALPWLLPELFAWSQSASRFRVADNLQDASMGAAYAAPLLLATSIVLSGASLIRTSPGRRPSYALFGMASIIPFATLATTLGGGDVGILVALSVLSGIAIAIATVAASGDAGRRHAPLSIGAGAAAALALAGWGAMTTHAQWAGAAWLANHGDSYTVVQFAESLGPLEEFDRVWAWFILAIPVVVALVAVLFHGRANRSAPSNALTLLPLALLLALATSGHGRAHDLFDERASMLGEGIFASAAGEFLEDVTFSTVSFAGLPTGAADVVLDQAGAIAAGRRVASASELSSFGATGGPGLSRAISDSLRARDDRDVVRIAADPNASGTTLLATCRAAWAQGARTAELVVWTDDGRPGAIEVHPIGLARGAHFEGIRLFLELDGQRARVSATDGTQFEVPRLPDGRLDRGRLRQILEDRRVMEPNRRSLIVVVRGGASVDDVLQSLAISNNAGLTHLSLTNEAGD